MPSQPADDHYALLGVDAGVDDEELRLAWRRLAARWHPDRAGAAATATFQRLSTAYEVLSDPLARMAYDRRRRASEPDRTRSPHPTPAAGAPPHPARPPAPAVMLSRLSRSFAALLATGALRFDKPGFITLVLNEAEAAQGGMAMVPMRVEVWCPTCPQRAPSAACARCGGRGTIDELFSAWLAIPPGVTDGEVLAPSVELPGMVEPVRFRIRLPGNKRPKS